MKGATEGGEIVQVEGGHIIRSTGRKDRHSKVFTAKGPRDRRVRLSAHTAIQFYDVQDRLGYDRPSKAVDWLIKKAKTAIDKLNELPPWYPNNNINQIPTTDSNPSSDLQQKAPLFQCNNSPSCSKLSFMETPEKSFFLTTSFPGFSNDDDSVSRANFQAEDLGLSLHTFQTDNPGSSDNQILPFQESFQRFDGWNSGGSMDNRVGFLMSSLGNSQDALFSHRELLQSNLAINPWNQTIDQQHNPQPRSSRSSDFELGFHFPARTYGEEEPDCHR